MTYYLQMDGVDDKLVIPSMVATEFILELKPRPAAWKLYINLTGKNVNRNGSNNADQFAVDYSAIYVDGVQATTNTAFMKINTRQVLRGVLSAAATAGTYVYWNGASSYTEGDLWDLKIYNGATLQAHYDMTLGNVQDQSGNGRHATLTGGTFISDTVTFNVTAAAAATTAATAGATKTITTTASAQSVSAATASLIKTRQATVSATATATTAASVIKQMQATPQAQALSTAAASLIKTIQVTATAAARVAVTATATGQVIKNVTAAATAKATAFALTGKLYGQTLNFTAHIQRTASGDAKVTRAVNLIVRM